MIDHKTQLDNCNFVFRKLNYTSIRKRFLILVFLVSTTFLTYFSSSAQQEWLYSQSQFNIYDLNGAYAGNYQELSLALRLRHQWAGLEGAPKSQYLSMHTPVVQNLGVGLRILNESIGARSRQKISGSLAVKLPLKNSYLGFGFNGGLLRQQYIQSKVFMKDELDPLLTEIGIPNSIIHFDVSAIWYSKKYYLGMEIQNLNEPSFDSQSIIDLQQKRHLVLIGGVVFKVNDKLSIKPTSKAFLDKNSELLLDVNLNVLLSQTIWIGVGIRKDIGVNFATEWNISKSFRLGYSYDYNYKNNAPGSHELFLGYNINTKANNANSIRYFK